MLTVGLGLGSGFKPQSEPTHGLWEQTLIELFFFGFLQVRIDRVGSAGCKKLIRKKMKIEKPKKTKKP